MASPSTVLKQVKKQKIGGGSKKGRRSSHNRLTGKYVRQRARTEARKARRRLARELAAASR